MARKASNVGHEAPDVKEKYYDLDWLEV